MTVGAAGAINTVLKSILDPGDEVIVLNPYFPEYRFYIENHGGRVVTVETGENFQPDIGRIAAALTPRTKALILNSPNNPTGAVYGAEVLRKLNAIIREPVLVISDEPYRPLIFDGAAPPETLSIIERAVLAWSWSKAMAIAGERIGYLAIPPHLPEAAALCQRLYVRQPHPRLHQCARHLAMGGGRSPDAAVDVGQYQAKRDLLCDALTSMGYDAPRPQGSFYVFSRTPIPDDLAFIRLLQAEGILAVPGSGSDAAGTCGCR